LSLLHPTPSQRSWIRCWVIVLICFFAAAVFSGNRRGGSGSTLFPDGVEAQVTATPTPAPPKSQVQVDPDLKSQVIRFLKAYYKLEPDDTESTHSAYVRSVEPSVSTKLLRDNFAYLDDTTNPLYQDRHNNQLAQEATVQAKKMKAEAKAGKAAVETVTMPVIVKAIRPDGVEKYHFDVETSSTWKKKFGKWALLDFMEYQSTKDGL
jgi:hypothetical protein